MRDCKVTAIIEALHILYLISSSGQTMQLESIRFKFFARRWTQEGKENSLPIILKSTLHFNQMHIHMPALLSQLLLLVHLLTSTSYILSVVLSASPATINLPHYLISSWKQFALWLETAGTLSIWWVLGKNLQPFLCPQQTEPCHFCLVLNTNHSVLTWSVLLAVAV